ncbi:recombinase family protein [Thermoactinospora rubra]|uniref:recombinase family protein n=1 Tax=Thermoactinospora rubra TaxID=1088767 RepID=UPI000A11D1F4|nr:recombinase family protein [Thermoactinospora rubra]
MTPKSQQMIGLLYARKSTYRARRGSFEQGRSVREQLDEERAWCAANDVVVGGEYVDDDRSASRFATRAREEFERLIADIEARKGHIVVCWESSRMQRDLAVYVRLRDACWRSGVLWCYNGRVYDLSKRDDRRVTAYDAIRDEDQSEAISEQVQRAMRANARAGRPHGRPLFGYRRMHDTATGNLASVVVDHLPRTSFKLACVQRHAFVEIGTYTRAWIVGEIFARIAARKSINSTVKWLNNSGIVTHMRSLWAHATIRGMVTNPAYIGKRSYKGQLIGDAIWPPLVEEAVFYTANEVLASPERRTNRDGSIKHLISMIAECAICRAPAATGKHRGNYRGYVCSTHRHFFCRTDMVDRYIEAALVRRLAEPDAVEFFAPEVPGDRVAEERAKIDRWNAELAQGEKLVEDGEMSMELLARMERRLRPLIEAAEARIRAASTHPLLASLIRPDVEEVWAEWRRLDIAQRRSVIRATMAYIRLSPVGQGRRNVPPSEYVDYKWRRP